jgi:ABC-2 type transport system permease protein
VLFSIATRNAPAGIIAPVIVGGLMQLYGFVGTATTIRAALLTTPFEAWHGLFAAHPYHGPILTGAIVSAVYVVVGLGGGAMLLRRRDFTQE